jgi:CubicO group peptidase (beta-lactamase class C family)
MPYTQVLFPPGSRYSYSNPGIVFLGRALEAATGDVYESYVDKNIFDALGMDTAYFDRTPWRLEGDRSNRYRIVRGRPVAGGPDFNTGVTVSNSGLNATIGDMAKWAAFLMGAPASRAAVHDQVLDRTSLEEMWHPVAAVPDSLADRPVSIGLSFFLLDDAGHPVVFHTGDQASFRSFLLVEPDARVALIGAYNTDGGDATAPDVDGIMRRAQERALDALFPLFRPGP